VGIWSRTTGTYDFERKLAAYRSGGDVEIWYIHPYERTLTVWRRQQDGDHREMKYTGGLVSVTSLSGIAMNLDDALE
jgi:Uma2 family endonuclease